MVEPCVKVRLANAFEFWGKDLEAPPFVMDIIRQGYSLPFSEFPPRCFQSNVAEPTICSTSFPGSLILTPGASEERPWKGLVTCLPESGR